MNLLIIAIQRANLTVGGMSYRFMALWDFLSEKNGSDKVFLLCTKSLYNKIYPDDLEIRNNVFIINDYRFYKPKALFFWLRAFSIVIRRNIDSVHIAGVPNLFIPFYYLERICKFNVIVTFASNSLAMASYNNKKAAKSWDRVLRVVKYIDILNPTYCLPDYNFKIAVSPCSFPYFLELRSFVSLSNDIYLKRDLILFVGALAETKNPVLALEGFENYCLNNPYTSYKLILVGKGPLEFVINEKIESFNSKFPNNKVVLHTQKDSSFIYNLMRQSKVFLSLQDFDNYPSQSLQEAMLFENCIIATDEGDTSLMVKKEYGNIILRDKLAPTLADAIENVTLNYNKNNAILNGKLIRENHNVNRFAKYFLSLHRRHI